jgi:hypothetical protein
VLNDLRQQLLTLRARDEEVRDQLAADGSLFHGYHRRMEEVHRDNAYALRLIIQAHGWPDEGLVGPDGAHAAWLIAQHAIAEPSFMRLCRQKLDEASRAGRIPRWQYAYIDDRIQVFEGKPQRFGTQIDLRPEGAKMHELEDPAQLDAWRQEVGLDPFVLPKAHHALPTIKEYRRKQAAELAWRQRAGGCRDRPSTLRDAVSLARHQLNPSCPWVRLGENAKPCKANLSPALIHIKCHST